MANTLCTIIFENVSEAETNRLSVSGVNWYAVDANVNTICVYGSIGEIERALAILDR